MSDPRPVEIVGDFSTLPASASGPRHLVWWGNIGFMTIEGTGFALAIAAYLYLAMEAPTWPTPGHAPPGLFWSSLFTVGLVLSAIPNIWVLRCARAKNERGLRIGTVLMTVIGLVLLIPRAFEFSHLGAMWYDDAYGSVLWLLVVLHTSHVVTDIGDTAVQAAWLWSHKVGDDQFADVEDNANYWTFVVVTWLPLFAIIQGLPRLLP